MGRFACGTRAGALVRAHVELFARRLVVVVPAGIGIAPPHRAERGHVHGGRCAYPLRTREPTGVVGSTRGSGRPSATCSPSGGSGSPAGAC
jgi:hypothetical protein